jgi:hypothetical protein
MNAKFHSLSPASADVLRNSLLELANVCPVEQRNPADCPLFALRKLAHRQRLQWISALDQIDMEYLVAPEKPFYRLAQQKRSSVRANNVRRT